MIQSVCKDGVKMEEIKKNIKISILIIILILTLLLFIFLFNYLRINIFYIANKDKYIEVFDVLGNTDNYVPQGLFYQEKYNIVLQTSYNKKNKPSMLFVTDFNSKKTLKEFILLESDGKESHKHVGGIAANDLYVFITNDYEVMIYSLDEIMNSTDKYIKALRVEPLPNRGDFVTFKDGILWIGDFYLKPFYNVKDDKPLLFGYDINNLDFKNPKVAVLLPKMVQGMTFTKDNKIILSSSFTYLINSKISIYENPFNDNYSYYEINNKKIPLYNLKEEKILSFPPMSEGIFYKDNYLYILFENSTNAYPLASPKMDKIIKYKLK